MRSQRGFTTIEVLVALVLVGGILIGGLGYFWQQRTAARRLAAHRAAETALENTYELLRAGALPLVPGPLPAPDGTAPELFLDVTPGEHAGTLRLDLVALYELDGQPHRRTFSALLPAP